MEYFKIDDRLFLIKSKGVFFLLTVFPYKIIKLNVDTVDEAKEVAADLKKEGYFNFPEPPKNYQGFYALEWVMTTECNLNCPHCFARVDESKSKYGLEKSCALTVNDLKRSVDFALSEFKEQLRRDGVKKGEFQIFIIGGEPLLEFNTLKEGIIYCRTKLKEMIAELKMDVIQEIYFLATNGLLLNDAIAEFIVQNPFTVAVSIDTPINPIKFDKNMERKTEVAVAGAKKLIEHGQKAIILNCVIPADKAYALDKIMEYLEGFGIMNKISGVQLSPLVPPSARTKFSGCQCNEQVVSDWSQDLNACKFFSKKLIEYCGKYNTDMKKYHLRVESMLKKGGLAYRCPVAVWKWSLIPGGDIYPCHQFIGIPKFKMGNIRDDFQVLAKSMKPIRDEFLKREVFKVEPCGDCPLKSCCVVFIDCPGRCYLEGGDMYKVPEHQCLMAKEYLLNILEEFIWKSVVK